MKTLLVIGSGPGIGLATAQRFAREGYRIVLTSRSLKNLQAQALQLSSDAVGVTLVEADASKPAQIAELVGRLSEEGPLTVLYNGGVLRYDEAGQLRPMSIDQYTMAELLSDMAINLTSVLVAIRAAVPAMVARGAGSIFITGGGFGIHPSPDFLPLSVGKAGIRAAAKGLFDPLKAQGIHIGTITVSQLVSPHSQAARDIADLFWKMESAAVEQWTWEENYG
jgi:short-subunit dehydrogenase